MIIWGWRRNGHVDWSGLLECAACQRWRIHYGVRIKRWLTIFFIPVLPLWGDRETTCAVCLHKRKLDAPEFEALRETGARNLRLAEQYEHDPKELQRQLALASSEDAAVDAGQLRQGAA